MLKLQFRLRTLLLIVTLWSIYFAAYFALMQPVVHVFAASAENSPVVTFATIRDTDYRFGGFLTHTLFSPLNWIDRWIRPKFWDDSRNEIL